MRVSAIILLTGFVLSGCYTQFSTLEPAPPSHQARDTVVTVDSSGDTVTSIKQVDTIVKQEQRTCIWGRDMFGYPQLQCYDSYYPHDYYTYNYAPWWYRNDPYWHDYDRCPRYYYYDNGCGCCRYYEQQPNYYQGWGGGGGGGWGGSGGSSSSSGGTHSPTSSHSYGVPSGASSSGSGTGSQPKETRPTKTVKQSSRHMSRSYGVPGKEPEEQPPKELEKSQTSSPPNEQIQNQPGTGSAPSVTPSPPPQPSSPSVDTSSTRTSPHRMSPRSWK
jgi:hypothetical protein